MGHGRGCDSGHGQGEDKWGELIPHLSIVARKIIAPKNVAPKVLLMSSSHYAF